MSVIRLDNVTFAYDRMAVLKDLSITIEENEFWAVIGPNGSGKSTFLKLISGCLKPRKGRITINNKHVKSFTSRQMAGILSIVHQEFVPVFGFSVMETVLMARYSRQKGPLFESLQDRIASENALKATETLEFADRSLDHLSGGERQRVFIARALAQETPIVLLDEPTSHLDLKHQIQVFDLLKKTQIEHKKTIILVTHDINLAAQYCDKVLLLGRSGIHKEGKPEEILNTGQIEAVFDVKGFHGIIQKRNFFIPLGSFSKDRLENDT